MMKHVLFWLPRAIALVFALGVTACFETKQDFTLNPDGSGKVVHECRFQPFNMNVAFGGEELSPEESMKRSVADLIEESEGVDAWDDIHFEQLDDGRILFRGTAWFPDLSKLKIENQSMLEFAWNRGPSGNGELTMVMTGDDEPGAETNTPPDDEEGRRKWLAAERGKFQQTRPMMVSMLTGMSHTATFRLPGKAANAHQFETTDDGHYQLGFHGGKFLTALDALVADDEWLLENGFSNDDGPEFDDALTEQLFGKPGVPSVTRTALDAPLFDYQAEVAAAQANEEAIAEKLGVPIVRTLPPAEGGPLKSTRLVGIRIGAEIDPALELRPFNHDAGLTLSILCEFDGAILEVDNKSALESATTDTGASLLPKSDFRRRIGFPKLSTDRAHALFDIDLATPPDGATTIKDLAGSIQYSVAGNLEELDLGITKIEEKQRGEELGAEIVKIEPGWNEDGPLNLEVRLNIRKNELEKAYLVTGERRRELENRGYSSTNNITTFTFELPKDYDANSSIVVEIHDEIRNYTTPFILRDIPLPQLANP